MTELTWNSATEWDSAQSEDGVVHESVANTDHDDDTVVKKGHSAATPYLASNLLVYYPLHDDSGSPTDFSGNNNDGTNHGATPNQAGLLGTTGYSCDGSDDWIEVPSGILTTSSDFTVACWFKHRNTSQDSAIWSLRGDLYIQWRVNRNGNGNLDYYDGNNYQRILSPLPEDTWLYGIFTYDDSATQMTAYIDNDQKRQTSSSAESRDDATCIGAWNGPNNGGHAPVNVWDYRIYDKVLSSTERTTLFDVVDTPGTLTTGKKTS